MTKASRMTRTDGEATRARILLAAGELFASTGYAEVTSKAIASRAQVDLASINYHFGNRNGLYQAVLVEAHHQLVTYDHLQQMAESPMAAEEKLRLLIGQLLASATAEPLGWHVQVLARELLSPSSHLQFLFDNALQPKIGLVLRLISEITHLPVDHPAIQRCLISVLAPCLVLVVGGGRLPGPLQDIVRMPRDTVVDHLHRFAMGGLAAIADAHRQARL